MKKSIIVVALVSVFSYGSSSEMCSLFLNKSVQYSKERDNLVKYYGSISDICFSHRQAKKYMIKSLSRCNDEANDRIKAVLESEIMKEFDKVCK